MAHLSPEASAKVREAMQMLLQHFGSKTALAKALKRSQPSVSDNLNHGGISVETARRVAKLCGVPLASLLGDDVIAADPDADRGAIRRVGLLNGYGADLVDRVIRERYRPGVHPDEIFAATAAAERERKLAPPASTPRLLTR